MRRTIWASVAASTVVAGLSFGSARAQPPAGESGREAIDAEFDRGLRELERTRLARLAELAGRQSGAEADRTYETYFRRALAAGLYREAEPTAEAVAKAGKANPQVAGLAATVNILAEADRGAYQESLDSLVAALAARKEGGEREAVALALPPSSRLAVLDIYYQRLLHADQVDAARKAMTLIRDAAADPAVKALATSRLAQIDLIGQPAPPISGKDIDGRPVSLDDFKGDVVLVVFWATWCLPDAQQVARLQELQRTYEPRGLRLLGVNVDALTEGRSAESVLPDVRRFLIERNVRWPNLINAPGEGDIAARYHVTDIPANVLIGRDGRVQRRDLSGSALEKAVAGAIGR